MTSDFLETIKEWKREAELAQPKRDVRIGVRMRVIACQVCEAYEKQAEALQEAKKALSGLSLIEGLINQGVQIIEHRPIADEALAKIEELEGE